MDRSRRFPCFARVSFLVHVRRPPARSLFSRVDKIKDVKDSPCRTTFGCSVATGPLRHCLRYVGCRLLSGTTPRDRRTLRRSECTPQVSRSASDGPSLRRSTRRSKRTVSLKQQYVLKKVDSGCYELPKTLSSFTFLMQYHKPAGNVATNICKSKKKENHVVGWCSETEAIMGIWIFA